MHMCTCCKPPLCIVVAHTCNSKSLPWGARTCEQCFRIKMASLSLKADRKCFMTRVSMPAFCTSGKGCMTSPTTGCTRSLTCSTPLAPNMSGRSTLWSTTKTWVQAWMPYVWLPPRHKRTPKRHCLHYLAQYCSTSTHVVSVRNPDATNEEHKHIVGDCWFACMSTLLPWCICILQTHMHNSKLLTMQSTTKSGTN